jgi:hypothetical protein
VSRFPDRGPPKLVVTPLFQTIELVTFDKSGLRENRNELLEVRASHDLPAGEPSQ